MSRVVHGEKLGLSDQLVAMRKRRGLRQLDVALEIGVCRVTVARFEMRGSAGAPTVAKIRRWMKATEALEAAEAAEAQRAAAEAAAAKKAGAGRAAAGKDGRAEVPGFARGRPRRALLTRLAVRQRTERALRIAAKKRARKAGKGRKGRKGRRGKRRRGE